MKGRPLAEQAIRESKDTMTHNQGGDKAHRQFWEAGYHVFPLNGFSGAGDDATCGCGMTVCKAAGKHPRAANWQHTPLWDEEQVDNIEDAGWFDSGYGVLCKGLLVIDVDVRNGGEEGYAALIEAFPDVAGAELIVRSGRGDGGRHLYFSLPDAPAMVQHLPAFKGIDFKSTGFVVGPGSRHASGGRYEIAYGGIDDIEPAPEALVAALRKPDRHRAEYDGRAVDVSQSDIAGMLAHIRNDDLDYEVFIRIGMAVHHSTGGTGFDLWDGWAKTSAKYVDGVTDSKWHSFGRSANPVTLGTLVHHAEQGGWVWPVTFDDADPGRADDHDDDPRGWVDVSGVDLKRPPGFTGKVAAWIGSKPIMPRDHIAVGAALYALGAVYSLHYTSQTSRATTNLLAFCVAGSRTGKESIEQGAIDVIRAAGLTDMIAGKFKSEQEIIRNLVRNQASFHIVDEIGLELQKLKNAQARGGTPYLEGIVGTIMSAYGKSNGVLPLTGDAKEEVRETLRKRLAQLERKKTENDGGPNIDQMIRQVEEAMDRTRDGLVNPLLGVIGFTTPVTFDGLLDFVSGTNGFVGRSLIFVEHDTTPKPRKHHLPPDMPEDVSRTILMLGTGGQSDQSGRIEHYGPRTVIPDTHGARDMLAVAAEWLHGRAVAEKSETGLESLWLGAYELVEKVSLILAVPEGLRTEEHVRWAFALIRRDVETKIRSVTSNDRARDNPLMALQSKIMNLCGGDDGERLGVIVNRCRGYKRDDVVKAIAGMVEAGTLTEEKCGGTRGPKSSRFRSA